MVLKNAPGNFIKSCVNYFTEMAIYHQGTDAGAFDSVEILTRNKDVFGCKFDDAGLIDNNDFAKSVKCYEV